MKAKKIIAVILAVSTTLGLMSACGKKPSDVTADGKVILTVGNWPDEETNAKLYETRMKQKAEFEEKYPDIVIQPDTWSYDVQTFAAKAEGGTLPILYTTFATESKKIMDLGYAADITDIMKEQGYYNAISDSIKNEISRDGKVYIIPNGVYSLGLVLNLNLFRQAGLVNADGTPKAPENFDELRAMAKTIKDKTGKAGFLFPTTANGGGWNFTNLAWNFGGEFMKETSDGWKAEFNDGTVKALQYLKDMMWEDKSLPTETLINNTDSMKLIAIDQAAMSFAHPDMLNVLTMQYGMDPKDIGFIRMPAGEEGHIALMGGDYSVIAPQATPEQIDAAFKWLRFRGILYETELTDDMKTAIHGKYKDNLDAGRIIGVKDINIWNSEAAVQSYTDEVIEEFRNIPIENVASYNDKTDMIYRTEEKMCAQDLYAILDRCIQEVLTKEDADCAAIIKTAETDFQNNYLNNIK